MLLHHFQLIYFFSFNAQLYTRMDLTKPIKKELLNGEGSSTSTEQHNHVVIDSSDSESSGVEENLPLQVTLESLFGTNCGNLSQLNSIFDLCL